MDAVDLNVFDGVGIRKDTLTWRFEAEWNAAGAVCAVAARVPGGVIPPCWWALQRTGCGAGNPFGEGTLLMTEYSPD